jgi:hypothetical protein
MARGNSIVLDIQVKGERSIQDLAANLDRVEVSADDARGELFKLTRGLDSRFDNLSRSVRGAAAAQDRLRRNTSSANQVLFSAGDAVQDIGVAFSQSASAGEALANAGRFAGNNVAFVAEQVATLSARAGSGAAALSALKASATGIGGALIGLQAGVVLLPKLIDLLNETNRELEALKSRADEAASAVINVTSVESADIGLQRAVQLRDAFQEQVAFLEEQERIQQTIRGLQQATGQGAAEAQAQLQRLLETNTKLSESDLSGLRNELTRFRALAAQTEEAVQRLQDQLAAERLARGTLLPESALAFDPSDLKLDEIENIEFPPLADLLNESTQEVEAAQKAVATLEQRLSALTTAEGRRLVQLEQQKQELEEQIGLARELIERGTLLPDKAFEVDASGLQLDEVAVQFASIAELLPEATLQAEIEAGLTTPLQGAQQEVSRLQGELRQMIDAGVSPASDAFQDVTAELEKARTKALAIGQAVQAIDSVARGVGEAIAFTIVGDSRAEERLREEQARLQEQLASTDNSDRRARIQKDLQAINTELQRFATLQGRIAEGFSQLDDVARNVLGRLINDLTTAVVKAAALKVIFTAFNVSTGGFGSLFKSALGFSGGGPAALAAGGFVSGAGTSTSDSILARLSDGEFVINAASTSAAPQLVEAINSDPGLAAALNDTLTTTGFASGGLVTPQISPSMFRSPPMRMPRRSNRSKRREELVARIDMDELIFRIEQNKQLKAQ